MPVTTNQLVELYLAYFGRPPDAAGVSFYTTGNYELSDVVRGFSASPESLAMYGPTFGAAQIHAIYQNLFNRDAEPAGLLHWQQEVSSGRITPAQAALSILQNAQNADRTAVQNKVAVAGAFLVQLDTPREIAGYSGAAAAALARTFLKTVDAGAASLDAALAALPAQVMLATGSTPPAATPPASPPPVFAVTKDGGNIVSFTSAGAQISVSEAGGTFTFTSGGATGTVTGPVAGIVVPAATTLSISSTLASGKTFSGTGTALVVANTAGEDLTAFSATGVTGFQLTSGQSYTLTAAQGAIGRIGAGGASGTLTDAGTTTVRDTLAALGGGVAATLKANGADSVIATTAAGADISAIAVAGIDSIVLVAGNYTMTAAQLALINTAPGAQAVTLTTQATGTLNAAVESFVLGSFANSVTLGAAAQNVSSAAGTATTLAIGGTAATGTWDLANGADVLVATNGANIAGVNSGAATTAENLALTGSITMTRDQHEALTGTVSAGGGADAVTITTTGVVAPKARIEHYTVAQAGTANTVSVSAAVAGVNITGGTGTATVVVDANVTATGTWSLNGASDGLSAATGTNISGVNGGAATTAESLHLIGAITMTQAQHQGFTSFTAPGSSDSITITTGGAVTAGTGINSYALSAGGANNLTVLAGATGITGAAANATTVNIGGNTVSGSWALANGADVIVATTGANISGVNTGGVTTAERLTLTGAITMTQAQHSLLTITAAGGSDAVTITDSGTISAQADIESYVLNGGASLILTAAKPNVNVSGAAGTESSISIGAVTAGGTWALGNALDTITASNGANFAAVNGGAATSAERLNLVNDSTITMTALQYKGFTSLQSLGTADRIVLTTALTGGETLNALVENFTLAAANSSVVLAANGQSINADALTVGQTLTLNGSFSGTVALSSGNITSLSSANVTVNGGTGSNTITMSAGDDTVNAGAGADLITGGGGADTLRGENGDDIFFFQHMGEFAFNSVVDQIDGGNGTDTAEITGAVVLATSSDLARMTNVEKLTVRAQSATQLAHTIAVNSDAFLSGLTTIDLSGDTKSTSTATIDFTGVTTGMTLKGTGAGSNTITGGSGADTLVGGSGDDVFIFNSAAAAAADTVAAGAGTDTVLFRSTAAETLVVGNNFSAGLSYLITTNFAAGAPAGATAENINASTHTLGGVKLYGNTGNNVLTGSAGADILSGGGGTDSVRGGGGNDTLTTAATGTTTYVFEATGSANGSDTLTGVRSSGRFDFREFLGAASLNTALVDATQVTAALTLSANNVGVRYGSSSLSSADIRLAADNAVAGEVVMANNGKAVVFSFSTASTGNSANGDIYYVEDTDPGAGQIFTVTLVGTMSGSSATVGDMVSGVQYL